jgi:hydrogenase-4 membrane subunit HyfE
MIPTSDNLLFSLLTLLFVSVSALHFVKKSGTAVRVYQAQSLVVAAALFGASLVNISLSLTLIAFATFALKVLAAPRFFFYLIKKHQLQFSASTYLNAPLTLVALAALIAFSYSRFVAPIAVLSPANADALLLGIAAMLISLGIVINHRGALFQMIGVLSLENAIVAFTSVAGLEMTGGLQAGILFDIFVWVGIAGIFVSMIYRHFGSLDATSMRHLKE